MTKWMLDEDDVIFSTEDPEGRSIHLTKISWNHIKENHAEIKIAIPQLRTIIQRPEIITDIPDRRSLAYTQITAINWYYNIYVKMDDTYQKGKISTAFKQGTLPRGGVIWTNKP